MVLELGGGRAVQRFLNKYGKDTTKRAYAIYLAHYLRWLKGKGVSLSPDELVVDNLQCVYKSDPTDVTTKRRHTDWLDSYMNDYLVRKGLSQPTRITSASAIIQFYKRNDSPLFGDFAVSRGRVESPAKALESEDIRKVPKSLSPSMRTPLLIVWQSGIEINRVLSLTWGQLTGIENGESPSRIELFGRKKHNKLYYSFIGRDGVSHLLILREEWVKAYIHKGFSKGWVGKRDLDLFQRSLTKHATKLDAASGKQRVLRLDIQGLSFSRWRIAQLLIGQSPVG